MIEYAYMLRSLRTVLACLLIAVSVFSISVSASETDGTIDSSNGKAYVISGDFGSIYFNTTNGDVHVTDGGLSGYAWGDELGWINLAPTNGGVDNDGEGNLSGYAWGQHTGWINFDPSNGGVTIDDDGIFHGYAWGQNVGWISFNCADESLCGTDDYKVETDWRPESARASEEEEDSGSSSGHRSETSSTPPPSQPNPTPESPSPEPYTDYTPPVTPASTEPVPASPTEEAPTEPAPGEEPVEPSPVEETITTAVDVVTDTIADITDSVSGFVEDIIRNTVGGGAADAFDRVTSGVREVGEAVGVAVEEGATYARETFNTTEGKTVSNVVATAGVVTTAAAALGTGALFASPLSIPEAVFIPIRLWHLLGAFLGIRRKKPWGTVYDSVTKMPLDPAYVTLKDESGKEVASSITDLDGRFGFFVPKGTYYISAEKVNYAFPSTKLNSKVSDSMYSDLYFGGKVEVSEDGAVISKNIPLDPQRFDWNEFEKNRMNISKPHAKELMFVKVANVLFWAGGILSAAAVIFAPGKYNIMVFCLYLALLILRKVGVKPRAFGVIAEEGTKAPLSFAAVSVYSPLLQSEVFKKVADEGGRYYALVPKGNYTVTVSKKVGEDAYERAFKKEIEAKKGVINFDIRV